MDDQGTQGKRCPDADALVRFAEGRSNPVSRWWMQRHLRSCPDCAVLALRLRRAAESEGRSLERRSSRGFPGMTVGGFTLAGAACGVLVTIQVMGNSELSRRDEPGLVSPGPMIGQVSKGTETLGGSEVLAKALHPDDDHVAEAIAEWEAVLALHPDDAIAQAALRRLRERQAKMVSPGSDSSNR